MIRDVYVSHGVKGAFSIAPSGNNSMLVDKQAIFLSLINNQLLIWHVICSYE